MTMNWTTPTFEEIKMDAEIGSYQEDGERPPIARREEENARRGMATLRAGKMTTISISIVALTATLRDPHSDEKAADAHGQGPAYAEWNSFMRAELERLRAIAAGARSHIP
jgi:hypothetical protein